MTQISIGFPRLLDYEKKLSPKFGPSRQRGKQRRLPLKRKSDSRKLDKPLTLNDDVNGAGNQGGKTTKFE